MDDDLPIRRIVVGVLQQNGYRTFEASDGLEALILAGRIPDPIHLLLTDIVMPNMDGLALADRLCSSRPETRVLYVSGCCDPESVKGRLDGPKVGFLRKPFTRAKLMAAVQSL